MFLPQEFLARETRILGTRLIRLDGGFRVIYDKEVPIELRLVEENKTENDEAGTLESIKTKILIQGEIESPECVKVELTSDADLFFHYSCM